MLSSDEYKSALYLRQGLLLEKHRAWRFCTNTPNWLPVREPNVAASTANMAHEQIAGLEKAG